VSAPYDVIVAGLGAMGSAVCDHLAGRGQRVLGLDRFSPPHDHGSSHGESRIIREAYFEDPAYVPLVQRAYQCWQALERDSGRSLLRMTGGLMIGPRSGALVTGALLSAETHRLEHRLLDAGEMRERHPQFALEEGHVAVWEPRAGFLAPESCVAAQLERAARRGAELRTGEPVLSWQPSGDGVEVTTARGRALARRLVLAAGAWMPELLAGAPLRLEVERVTLYWFDPAADGAAFAPERMPIWIWEHERDRYIYGFPRLARGIKIARHHEGQRCLPGDARPEPGEAEIASMRELVRRRMPGAAGALREAATCLYTNSPDQHFVIDAHPECEAVLVVSACSGHGFKFASAIGELVAGRLLGEPPRFDLALFRLGRFAGSA
jgi:sarcosine oxidase